MLKKQVKSSFDNISDELKYVVKQEKKYKLHNMGESHSWQEFYDIALKHNGRLPTVDELKSIVDETGHLVNEDTWVPCGNPREKDWV